MGRVLRILVVDDDPDLGPALAELLELMGHRPRVARDGDGALSAALDPAPDLVLCDLGLPDMDGFELARRLQRERRIPTRALVALSGRPLHEVSAHAVGAGFSRCLEKPIDVAVLEALLAGFSAAEARP